MASLATWFLTPLVFIPLTASLGESDLKLVSFDVGNTQLHHWNGIPRLICLRESCHPILFYPIMVLVVYFRSAFVVYVVVPLYDIGMGFRNLFCHDTYKNDFYGFAPYSDAKRHALWPAMKLAEQFGEAVPQFGIALVFFSKNAHWLSPWEMFLGGVSMTLSCGSILFGVIIGIKTLLESKV